MRWWVWCLVAAQEPTPPPERRRAVRALAGGESYDSIVKRLSEVVDKLPGLGALPNKSVIRELTRKPTDSGSKGEQPTRRTATAPDDENREDQVASENLNGVVDSSARGRKREESDDSGSKGEHPIRQTATAPDDENREDQVASENLNEVVDSSSPGQAPPLMKPFVSTSEMRGAVSHTETSHRVPHASVSLHISRAADEQQKTEGKIKKKLQEEPLAQSRADVTALDSALQAVSILHVNNKPPPAEPPEPVKGFMPGTRLPIHMKPPPQHTCDEGKNLVLKIPLTSYPSSLELPLMSVQVVVDRVKPPHIVVTDELTQARALFKPAPSILGTEILSDGPISVSGSVSRFVQLPTGGKLKGAQSEGQSAKSGAAGTDKRLNQGRKLDPAPDKQTLLTKGVEKAAGDLAAFGGEAAFMNSLKRLVQHLTVKYWTLGRCPRDYSRDCPVGFTFGDNGYCNPNSMYFGPCRAFRPKAMTPEEKEDLSWRCHFSYACVRNAELDRNLRRCPLEWNDVDGVCVCPTSYNGICSCLTDFRKMTDAEVYHWTQWCGVRWKMTLQTREEFEMYSRHKKKDWKGVAGGPIEPLTGLIRTLKKTLALVPRVT